MYRWNPFTNKLDFIQDISGKLNTDQTIPQTMTGTFTFPIVKAENFIPTSSYTVSRDVNGDIIKYTYANGREIDITRVAGIITKYEDSEYEYIIERTGDVFDGLTINEK